MSSDTVWCTGLWPALTKVFLKDHVQLKSHFPKHHTKWAQAHCSTAQHASRPLRANIHSTDEIHRHGNALNPQIQFKILFLSYTDLYLYLFRRSYLLILITVFVFGLEIFNLVKSNCWFFLKVLISFSDSSVKRVTESVFLCRCWVTGTVFHCGSINQSFYFVSPDQKRN